MHGSEPVQHSVLSRSELASAEPLLNRLRYPVVVIGDEFEVLFQNKQATQTYGLGRTCHEVFHNRTEPCTTDEALCPMRVAQASGRLTTARHVHRVHGAAMPVLECAIPLDSGDVVAIHLPVDQDSSVLIRRSASWGLMLAVVGLGILIPGAFVGTIGAINAFLAVVLGAVALGVCLGASQATHRGLGPSAGRSLRGLGIAVSAITLLGGLALGATLLVFALRNGG